MSLAEQFEENEQYEQAYEEYKKELDHKPYDRNFGKTWTSCYDVKPKRRSR